MSESIKETYVTITTMNGGFILEVSSDLVNYRVIYTDKNELLAAIKDAIDVSVK